MNIDLARHMARTAFESGALLQDLLLPLKTQCSAQDYREHAHAIAEAIDKINTALLDPALAAQPTLRGEIDASIRATGRYRL